MLSLIVFVTTAAVMATHIQALEFGIDVSHYQGKIDWKQVSTTAVKFAFIKATEGATYSDPMFRHNFQAAKSNGLRTGVYHFFKTTSSPQDQLKNLVKALKTVDFNPATDMLAIDVEQGSISGRFTPLELSTRIRSLLVLVATEIKVKPLIYTSATFWRDTIHTPAIDLSSYHLWIVKDVNVKKSRLSEWEEFMKIGNYKLPVVYPGLKNSSVKFWQFSIDDKSIRIPGLNPNIDLNIARFWP